MKEYFSFPFSKREKIIEKIKKALFKKEEVVFGYVFGSFLDSPSFRDIDIGVYLKDIEKKQVFDREIELAGELAKATQLPFDLLEVKILNFAPLSFQNSVFSKGRFLFSKDEKLSSGLIEESSLETIANAHLAYQSLKELVPA